MEIVKCLYVHNLRTPKAHSKAWCRNSVTHIFELIIRIIWIIVAGEKSFSRRFLDVGQLEELLKHAEHRVAEI